MRALDSTYYYEWNRDIMKGQGTANYVPKNEVSILHVFGFFSIHFAHFSIAGAKNIICYTEDFVI